MTEALYREILDIRDTSRPKSKPPLIHGLSLGRRDMGFSTETDRDIIVRHRRSLCDELSLPYHRLRVAEQVHSATVTHLTAEHTGRAGDDAEPRVPPSDGLVTDLPNVPLMVLSADCALLLVFDPRNVAVGVAHAGWRGTTLGITGELIRKMSECFSSVPTDLRAAVSPAAGACCYEVGDEVVAAVRRIGIDPDGVLVSRGQSIYFDLAEANRRLLIAAGVPANQVSLSSVCTVCNREYFSYRRDGAGTGRFALIAAIANSARRR